VEYSEEYSLKEDDVTQDYTCVPRGQLAMVFHRHHDPMESLVFVAARADQDVRDLKKIVNGPGEGGRVYLTTGLGLADRIMLAIGQNITALEMQGEITVIPTSAPAALRMAADEAWVREEQVPRGQLRQRAEELMLLRKEALAIWA